MNLLTRVCIALMCLCVVLAALNLWGTGGFLVRH